MRETHVERVFDRAQNQIWEIILDEQRREPAPPTARIVLVTDAINDMFDARTARNTSLPKFPVIRTGAIWRAISLR